MKTMESYEIEKLVKSDNVNDLFPQGEALIPGSWIYLVSAEGKAVMMTLSKETAIIEAEFGKKSVQRFKANYGQVYRLESYDSFDCSFS